MWWCIEKGLDRSSDFAIIFYLYANGYGIGIFAAPGEHLSIEDLRLLDIRHVPTYVVVESSQAKIRAEGGTHAVYWDGERIHDPNPDADLALSDYKILGITPIVRIENHERWKNNPESS